MVRNKLPNSIIVVSKSKFEKIQLRKLIYEILLKKAKEDLQKLGPKAWKKNIYDFL